MMSQNTVKAGERTHSLHVGDIVEVRNSTMGGEPIIEGKATIASLNKSTDHCYNVRFHNDGHRMTYPRFVLPEHLLIEGETI